MPQSEEKYVWITLEEVMEALSNCSDPNVKRELCKIYENEDYNELGKKRISKESNTYQMIRKFSKKEDFSVTIELLSQGLSRAIYECNHSIRNKLTSYMHQFLDNIALQKENDLLIYTIMNDKEVLNYLKKFPDWDSYQESLKQKGNQKIKSKPIDEVKKSFVIFE